MSKDPTILPVVTKCYMSSSVFGVRIEVIRRYQCECFNAQAYRIYIA